ncbi:hypothetical protein U1Q18_017738 [Sarracenia purpurea var. burkii]
MVGGCGGNPFVLSLQILHSISSSPFSTNTGKSTAKFASWIHEQQNNLMEEGIDLPADLPCSVPVRGWCLHHSLLVQVSVVAIALALLVVPDS